MRKGFTLVELLAVIIVLGIILVITIPKVLNLVDVSKEGTFKSNVNEALNITKMHFNEKFMMKLNPNATYNFNNGNIEVNGESLSITKGEMDLVGYISINEDGESKISLSNDKYCAVKKYGDGEIQVYKAGSANCVVSDRTMLTVVLNGGELRSPFAESYQPKEIVPLTRPTKKSAVFAGWAVTKGNSVIQSGNLIMGTKDTTITAMWGDKFSLTVVLNGGTLDQQFEEEYAVGTEIELGSPVKDGNVFTNWRVTEGNSTIVGNTFTMGSEDTVIEAVFTTCEAGTYAMAGATSCTSCGAGTYSGVGSTSCTSCQAGTYAGAGSSSCTPCAKGSYSGTGASGCTVCGAGKTTTTTGTSSASSCTSCSIAGANTYATPTWSANSVSNLCKVTKCNGGYKLANNSCTKCTAGTYAVTGSTSCTSCAKGSYSAAGASSCIACQPSGATGTNGTTSAAGQSSCNASCNKSNVSTWKTASWSNNVVSNSCTINTCVNGYNLSNNTCVKRSCKTWSSDIWLTGGSCAACDTAVRNWINSNYPNGVANVDYICGMSQAKCTYCSYNSAGYYNSACRKCTSYNN